MPPQTLTLVDKVNFIPGKGNLFVKMTAPMDVTQSQAVYVFLFSIDTTVV